LKKSIKRMRSSQIIKGAGATYGSYDWDAGSPAQHPPTSMRHLASSSSRIASADETGQAYQRGYQEGEAAAKEAQEQAIAALAAELAKTIASLSRMRSSIFQDAQGDLVRLAVAIARRILHRELLLSPDILEGIISVVLDRLDGQEVYRVRVHPSMVPRVEQKLNGLARHQGIKVAADPSLGTGGCVFETGRGNIDAGVESQLSEIERGLADHLEDRR
jgi:flagellar assembly protein FliH